MLFCKKHSRYLAVRKPRVSHRKKGCSCWSLFLLQRVVASIGFKLKIGRPVIHRRKHEPLTKATDPHFDGPLHKSEPRDQPTDGTLA